MGKTVRSLFSSVRVVLLVIVLLAVLPAVGLALYDAWSHRQTEQTEAQEKALTLARYVANQQQHTIEQARQLLIGLAAIEAVREHDAPVCDTIVSRVFTAFPRYTVLGAATLDGNVFCLSAPRHRPFSIASRSVFQQTVTTRAFTVGGFDVGVFSGKHVMVVSLPAMTRAGEMKAVVFAGIDLRWISDVLANSGAPAGTAIAVVDRAGIVLARSSEPDRWIGTRAPAAMLNVVAGHDGQPASEGTGTDADGHLFAFTPLFPAMTRDANWVFTTVPAATVLAHPNSLLKRDMVGLTIMGILALVAALMIGERALIRRIHALARTANRFGAGDLTARSGLAQDAGPLGDLARSFDDMAASLERVTYLNALILRSAAEGIWGIDAAGRAVFVNDAGAAMLGYEAREILGQDFHALVHHTRADGTRYPESECPSVRASIEGGTARISDEVFWRKDGTSFPVEYVTTPMRDGDRIVGIVVVASDIAERRRAEAERRIQSAALAAAANGIVITDREGRVEWVNAAFTRMTGYAPDEIRGRTPSLLKSGAHPAEFYRELWRTIRTGRVWHGELVNRRKDGSLYPEEQTITPIGDEHGITHFVAIKQDISDRRAAAEALRRREDHFRALIENALDITAIVDSDGAFQYASPSVERALGYSADELHGTSLFALMHEDDRALVRPVFTRDGDRTATTSVECRVRHRDGTWRTFEITARNFLSHPSVAGIVLNSRDVTERRRAEETERRLQEQLLQSEKLAAMGELLAGVAHELNNPLAILVGHAALLRSNTTDRAVAARAQKISAAADRCTRIVRNFLALSRQHPHEREALDVNDLVREAAELLAYPLRVDSVTVIFELDDDLPPLWGDRHQIQQVMINLLTNAHHALRERDGVRRLTITTRLDRTRGTVRIDVADNGPGIPPENVARLFEPFFTTKPVGQGTGLGLPICRGIIEAHGGRMTVNPGPGVGATLSFELPLGSGGRTRIVSPESVRPAAGQRILVVDDEPEVARVLAEMLALDGYRVDVADNGQTAIEKIAVTRYDAILSDVKMPQMDGPGLYRALKQRDPSLLSRMAFITGDVANPSTTDFLESTAVPCLKKPLTADDLRAGLRRVMYGSVS